MSKKDAEKQSDNQSEVERREAARKRQLAGLRPFKPGQSGNPKGRPPKKECMTSLAKEMMNEVCPYDKQGRTWLQVAVTSTLQQLIKGNSTAIKEIWDRVDGKLKESIDVRGSVDVTTMTAKQRAEELAAILRRARKRKNEPDTTQ